MEGLFSLSYLRVKTTLTPSFNYHIGISKPDHRYRTSSCSFRSRVTIDQYAYRYYCIQHFITVSYVRRGGSLHVPETIDRHKLMPPTPKAAEIINSPCHEPSSVARTALNRNSSTRTKGSCLTRSWPGGCWAEAAFSEAGRTSRQLQLPQLHLRNPKDAFRHPQAACP